MIKTVQQRGVFMKKFLFVVLALTLLLSLTAVAEGGETINVKDISINVTMPDFLHSYTRDTLKDDSFLESFGMTAESLGQYMSQTDCYLVSFDEIGEYEVLITSVESAYDDFNLFSEKKLKEFIEIEKKISEESGLIYTYVGKYPHKQTEFVKVHATQPSTYGTTYYINYYTAYRGDLISVIVRSYSKEVDDKRIFDGIVDSIVFEKEAIDFDKTNAVRTFTNVDTGTTIKIPDGWIKSPMSGFYGPTLFESTEKYNCIATYIIDNEEQKDGYIDGASTTQEVYNGRMYFTWMDKTDSGSDLKKCLTIHNGYLHYFTYRGDMDGKYYDQFADMIGSLTDGEIGEQKSILPTVAVVVIVIAVLAVAICIFLRKKKKPTTEQ